MRLVKRAARILRGNIALDPGQRRPWCVARRGIGYEQRDRLRPPSREWRLGAPDDVTARRPAIHYRDGRRLAPGCAHVPPIYNSQRLSVKYVQANRCHTRRANLSLPRYSRTTNGVLVATNSNPLSTFRTILYSQ